MPVDAVVADANALIHLAATDLFAGVGFEIVVPALAQIECASALHAIGVREGEPAYAAELHRRIVAAPMRVADRDADAVWELADQLGWAKTYDAEYLVLALRCELPLATFDGRVRRAAASIGVLLVDLPG